MDKKEAEANIQNTQCVDINRPPPAAALKMTCERTLLKVSGLDELKRADEALLTKITDLEIDLTDADLNSQNIEEAPEILKNRPQLIALRLKMPEHVLRPVIKFKL